MPKKHTKAKAGKTGKLEAIQQKIWKANLALALAVFAMLAVWWIGVALGFFPAPSARDEWLMEQADLTAIVVFAVDIYSGFRKASDKKLFLRKNWLEIIVLLPFGTAFRMFRAFEQLEIISAVKKSASVMEIPLVVPDVVAHAKQVGKGALEVHQWVSHGKVFTDISDTVSNFIKGLPKI